MNNDSNTNVNNTNNGLNSEVNNTNNVGFSNNTGVSAPVSPVNNSGDVVSGEPIINANTVNTLFGETNTPTTQQVNNNNNALGSDNGHPNGSNDLKKVEINYKPLSGFKTFILIVFFLALIGFVLFLPEINQLVNKYMNKEVEEEKITTGRLTCSLESNTSNLTDVYGVSFRFEDNKLKTVKFETETKGSTAEDVEALDKLNEDCKHLKEVTENMSGVNVSCEYKEGDLLKKQSFELGSIDFDALDSAYSETGGTMIEYRLDDDMDNIETSMNAAGYDCKRER